MTLLTVLMWDICRAELESLGQALRLSFHLVEPVGVETEEDGVVCTVMGKAIVSKELGLRACVELQLVLSDDLQLRSGKGSLLLFLNTFSRQGLGIAIASYDLERDTSGWQITDCRVEPCVTYCEQRWLKQR